jgi:hypothetical protein
VSSAPRAECTEFSHTLLSIIAYADFPGDYGGSAVGNSHTK